MTRYTDGKKIVEVGMYIWNGTNLSPGFESDILAPDVNGFDVECDAYIVNDVDTLIDLCDDWVHYHDDETRAYGRETAMQEDEERGQERVFHWGIVD